METTIQPVVSTTQHGSGVAATSTDLYNTFGQVVWSQDAAGSISYTAYNPATGAVVEQVQDANVNSTNSGQYPAADWALLPSAWQTTGTAAENLVTTYQVDSQGRTIEETDPDGNVTYTVYNNVAQETRTYPGWHDVGNGVYETTGPIQVSRTDLASNYSESLTYTWIGTGYNGLPTNVQRQPYRPGGLRLIPCSDPVAVALTDERRRAGHPIVGLFRHARPRHRLAQRLLDQPQPRCRGRQLLGDRAATTTTWAASSPRSIRRTPGSSASTITWAA